MDPAFTLFCIILAFTLGLLQGRSRWRTKPAWDGPEFYRQESVYVTGIHGHYTVRMDTVRDALAVYEDLEDACNIAHKIGKATINHDAEWGILRPRQAPPKPPTPKDQK
jgi:hypothetical protein